MEICCSPFSTAHDPHRDHASGVRGDLARTLPLGSVSFESKIDEDGNRLIWLGDNVTSTPTTASMTTSLALAHWMPRLSDERFKIAVCGESEHLTSTD